MGLPHPEGGDRSGTYICSILLHILLRVRTRRRSKRLRKRMLFRLRKRMLFWLRNGCLFGSGNGCLFSSLWCAPVQTEWEHNDGRTGAHYNFAKNTIDSGHQPDPTDAHYHFPKTQLTMGMCAKTMRPRARSSICSNILHILSSRQAVYDVGWSA